jgi:AraC family L-rhamnose operon transcriptional activator RhaR
VSTELLDNELAWTRNDALLSHLFWTGPMAAGRQGRLTFALDDSALDACRQHLDALNSLRTVPVAWRRAGTIGHLLLLAERLADNAPGVRDGLNAPTTAIHRCVTEAIHLLESRLAHNWTLIELAAELHLTASYLVRLFRANTGLPPMTYLARRRAETAAALLLHTDEPITHIAGAVGWPNQSHFAHRFKTHMGMSAHAYRQAFACGEEPHV